MRTAALSMGNSSQTRARGRAVPVSGQVGYQPTAPHNQHNRISTSDLQNAVQPYVTQSRDQSSAKARNQQLSQRFGGGSQTSFPPNSAMPGNSYEHIEAESTSESSKCRIALAGKGKGRGQGSFLSGGAQIVGTSGKMGVAPTFLPVMQFGGQHPGGVGVPTVGMAFPGCVAQSQLGLGNSEMSCSCVYRLPLLTGAAGALGATYCSPYMAVDGSYHARSSGQTSSMSSLRLALRMLCFQQFIYVKYSGTAGKTLYIIEGCYSYRVSFVRILIVHVTILYYETLFGRFLSIGVRCTILFSISM